MNFEENPIHKVLLYHEGHTPTETSQGLQILSDLCHKELPHVEIEICSLEELLERDMEEELSARVIGILFGNVPQENFSNLGMLLIGCERVEMFYAFALPSHQDGEEDLKSWGRYAEEFVFLCDKPASEEACLPEEIIKDMLYDWDKLASSEEKDDEDSDEPED